MWHERERITRLFTRLTCGKLVVTLADIPGQQSKPVTRLPFRRHDRIAADIDSLLRDIEHRNIYEKGVEESATGEMVNGPAEMDELAESLVE